VPGTRQASGGTAGRTGIRRFLFTKPTSSANRLKYDLSRPAHRSDRHGNLAFYPLSLPFGVHSPVVTPSFLELDSACSFLVSGLFGLFLALRITYRWEIPFAESLKHWHVEAGSAMVFAAVIHLTWHLSYYLGKSGRQAVGGSPAGIAGEPAGTASPGFDPRLFRPLLMLTGFVSSASQFILMREALILGGGTEAIAGLFLWLWLMIAAGGSLTGARSTINSARRMMWTLIGCTLLAPMLLLMMTTIILSPGQTPSFFQALVILAVSVAPVTFISALIFVRISILRNATGHSGPGNSFGTETAGSVAAGVVTALTVTLAIPNFQLYLLILIVAVRHAGMVAGLPPGQGLRHWPCCCLPACCCLSFLRIRL
jgi:hypothetical protein